jgi:EmrB/QacA subfamily drug resistance transporter
MEARSNPAEPAPQVESYDSRGRRLVWAAMIPAVAMTFIDVTIVSIAVPEIQKDLGLTATGIEWVITGFLVSMAALTAFGGRLGDIFGHRRMVVLGVIIFATSSLMCGLTPDTSIAEPWLIVFRVIQGAGSALIFPSALTLVLNTYPLSERGKAISQFFILAGLFTAIGPIAGGYLSEWTWRSIFWVNIPVAIAALILTAKAHPIDRPRPARIDFRGLALLVGGMALAVLGIQQSSAWGWGSPATWACIVVGALLLVLFVRAELGIDEPLIRVRMFANRAFISDTVVVLILFAVFVPVFFFSSLYSQISLGYSVGNAGLYMAIFFGGFALGSRRGGDLVDKIGVKRPVIIGSGLAIAGFVIWGMQATDLSLGSQWYGIVIAGAGVGLCVSPSNTDAINQVPGTNRGEAVGVLMTGRNFGSSVGLAALGTVLFSTLHSKLDASLTAQGIPNADIDAVTKSLTQAGGGDSSALSGLGTHQVDQLFNALQHDFAEATQVILFAMAGMMAVVLVLGLALLRAGRVEATDAETPT